MNQRIKQLAEQCEDYLSNVIRNDEWLEKFAELIVRECALQCVHNEDMDLIEKHFGVDI